MAKSRYTAGGEERAAGEETEGAAAAAAELMIGGGIFTDEQIPFGLLPWQWHIAPKVRIGGPPPG